ncbi:uncharacterized protein LAJ45_11028 [Morchella importuna]|nr:uncharacterized protein LAJ45_11028 [Morchella importuna]KAH8145008.1 hypothetical protein LAJ45_11028 [Morchella importuna]
MATRASLQRRQALGLLNGNVSTHRAATPRRIDSEFDHEKLRREGQVRVLGKHSIDFLDDAQIPKAARYTETHDKRLGIEHWLEDGVVDGGLSCSSAHDDDTAVLGQLTIDGRDRSFCHSVSEPLINEGQEYRYQEERFAEVDKGCFESRQRLDSLVFPRAGRSDYPLQTSVNPEAPVSEAFSSSAAAAATALRLRLRVALFKVQTNQTAIPISHLQLPEASPQPLSVFPPSLVRVSTERNAHDEYCGFFYGDDINTAPPSSPPPLTMAGTLLDELPFLVPTRSSSPSAGLDPLQFGSSTILPRRISLRNH